MAVSIRDIADRAGVSRGTVSKILNGSVEVFTPETKQRVQFIADELGYHPNRMARSLGRRRTDSLGLMIYGLSNPFFLEVLHCAEDMAKEGGFQVIVDSKFREIEDYPRNGKLMGWPVDGFLMWSMPGLSLRNLLGEQAANSPVVYMGHERSDGANCVAFDFYAGSRQAMEYLWEQGHRHIAFICNSIGVHTVHPDGRNAAYRDVCRERGLLVDEIAVNANPNDTGSHQNNLRGAGLQVGIELAARPTSERPTAVFCYNDLTAIAVLHGLRRAGLRVPEDVAVVGFDGINEGQFLDKRLTTVVAPVEPIVQNALRILRQQLDDPKAISQTVLIPTSLRIGDTS